MPIHTEWHNYTLWYSCSCKSPGVSYTHYAVSSVDTGRFRESFYLRHTIGALYWVSGTLLLGGHSFERWMCWKAFSSENLTSLYRSATVVSLSLYWLLKVHGLAFVMTLSQGEGPSLRFNFAFSCLVAFQEVGCSVGLTTAPFIGCQRYCNTSRSWMG